MIHPPAEPRIAVTGSGVLRGALPHLLELLRRDGRRRKLRILVDLVHPRHHLLAQHGRPRRARPVGIVMPAIPVDLHLTDLEARVDLAIERHRLIRVIMVPEHLLIAPHHQLSPQLTMRPARSSGTSFGITKTPALPSITFSPVTSISTKLVSREPQKGAPRNARDN